MNSPLLSRACFGSHLPATPEESEGFRAPRWGVTRMLRGPDLRSKAHFSSGEWEVRA